jgi:hypothetical protein
MAAATVATLATPRARPRWVSSMPRTPTGGSGAASGAFTWAANAVDDGPVPAVVGGGLRHGQALFGDRLPELDPQPCRQARAFPDRGHLLSERRPGTGLSLQWCSPQIPGQLKPAGVDVADLTSEAPRARANCVLSRPTGPAPAIRTRDPALTSALRQVQKRPQMGGGTQHLKGETHDCPKPQFGPEGFGREYGCSKDVVQLARRSRWLSPCLPRSSPKSSKMLRMTLRCSRRRRSDFVRDLVLSARHQVRLHPSGRPS